MWLWAVKLFSKLTSPGPLLPTPHQLLALLTRDPPRGKSTARYQVVWAQKGFSAPCVEMYRFPGCIGLQASRTEPLHRLCILPAIPRGAPSQAAQATEHQCTACEIPWLIHLSSLSWFCLCGALASAAAAMQTFQPEGVTGTCHLLPKIPFPSTPLVVLMKHVCISSLPWASFWRYILLCQCPSF